MNSQEFKTVIGLEIHAQLDTKSKMFCSCDNDSEGKKPNEVTCPICMGMPGTLPVANFDAIKKTVKTGLALGCEINSFSKFDRKHYFYPDLPKGYQISQYDKPFCLGGNLKIEGEQIRFNRIHLEEDAGKLLHPKSSRFSIVDLNRAGTPLMEMVTEPDITSPHIAKVFLRELQQILRSLKVSSADMEKGHFRCDANINVMKADKSSPIIELKNLNSFRFIEKALLYEEDRLKAEFETFSGTKTKQTRRFDAGSGKTLAMREKEEAKDYRYFPEPDLPPFKVSEILNLEELRAEVEDELPGKKLAILEDLGLDKNSASQITKDLKKFNKFESVLEKNQNLVLIASRILINEKNASDLSDENLVNLCELIYTKQIPSNIVREIIVKSISSGNLPSMIFENEFIGSYGDVMGAVKRILKVNPDVVEKYKSGKKEVTGFLMGQVMREVRGKANPNDIKKEIEKQIGGQNG